MVFIIFLIWFSQGCHYVLFFFLFYWILFWRYWLLFNLWLIFTFWSLIYVLYLVQNCYFFTFLFFFKLMFILWFRLLFFLYLVCRYPLLPNIIFRLLFNVKVKIVITANCKPKLSLLLYDLQFFLCNLSNHFIVRLCSLFFEGLYFRNKQYSSDVSTNLVYVLQFSPIFLKWFLMGFDIIICRDVSNLGEKWFLSIFQLCNFDLMLFDPTLNLQLFIFVLLIFFYGFLYSEYLSFLAL